MWSVNDGLSGFFINKKKIEKKYTYVLIKNLETCRKPPRPVSGGFQQDNPSLTDHTVGINVFEFMISFVIEVVCQIVNLAKEKLPEACP